MKKLMTAIAFAVATASVAALPAASYAQIGIGISVGIAPPPIPIYVQPPIPAPDYLWTPGYWAWNGDDYYFVPGSWIAAPTPGYLWTPGYWGFRDGGYFFNDGYWGPHIGFYGGIDYGFGYGGEGYRGGYWRDGHFSYNQSVNNINVNVIHNVYNERIPASGGGPRVGYNGGQGGITAQPSAAERQAQNFPHTPATAAQAQQVSAARADRNQLATVNHGAPPVAATARPGEFSGAGVTRATAPGGPVAREAARPAGAPAGAAHPPQTAVQNAQRATARTAAPRPEGLVQTQNRPVTTAARPPVAAARPAVRPAPAPVAPRPAAVAPPREAVAPRPMAPAPAAHPEAPRGNPGGGKEEHH